MASEQFALPQGWRITRWEVATKGPIPEDAFVVGGTLLVALAQETFPPVYTLAWLDGGNRWSTVAGLDLSVRADTLAATGVEAKIGKDLVRCRVQLLLSDPNGGIPQLSGEIQSDPFSTGNSGSFAAEAHIPPLDEGSSLLGRLCRFLRARAAARWARSRGAVPRS